MFWFKYQLRFSSNTVNSRKNSRLMSFWKENHIIHVYLHIKSNYLKIQLWQIVKTRFNILIILNISFHGPIQHPIVFHLSTFGIQCIFLTNQQWAYETRVGIYDWIAGGEVQVGNTGRVTLRRSLPQLPHVGERFTWLNLISFPLLYLQCIQKHLSI